MTQGQSRTTSLSKQEKKLHYNRCITTSLAHTYALRRAQAKVLLFVMVFQTIGMTVSNLVAAQPEESYETRLDAQDLNAILTSSQPLVYLGKTSKARLASCDVSGSIIPVSRLPLDLIDMLNITPITVTISNDQIKNSVTTTLYQCDDAQLPPSVQYEGFTIAFQPSKPHDYKPISIDPESIYIDPQLDLFGEMRAFNDSYIKVNSDKNANIRITGSADFLGIITAPGLVSASLLASSKPLAIDPSTGQIGVGNSSYTFTGNVYVQQGATLFVSEIDPRSPTTTTTFSGSISLPVATTANNGSLQINGVPFLHNFGTNNTFAGAPAGNLTMSGGQNVAVGATALQKNISGSNNTALGQAALQNNTTGSQNTASGVTALQHNTTGSNNTASGYQSLLNFRVGSTGGHTALGAKVLDNLVSGTANTAIGNISDGTPAGTSLMAGSDNIYFCTRGAGFESQMIRLGNIVTHTGCLIQGIYGVSIPTGSPVVIDATGRLGTGSSSSSSNNYTFSSSVYLAPSAILFTNEINPRSPTTTVTFSGSISVPNTTTANHGSIQFNGVPFLTNFGGSNTFVGATAGNFTMTGFGNTAVGANAMRNVTTGQFNNAVGANALMDCTSGSENIAIGDSALGGITTGSDNIGIGQQVGIAITKGSSNIAIGGFAMQNWPEGSNNIAIGTEALLGQAGGGGSFNTVVGSLAMSSNALAMTSTSNTAIGYFAMQSNGRGVQNTAVGAQALSGNANGNFNTAIGQNSMGNNTNGGWNVAIGQNSLSANVTAFNNTAIGFNSMAANTTGGNNTAVGANALDSNTTGTQNTAVGQNALTGNTTGNFNTAMGQNALAINSTGGNNVAVGQNTLRANTIAFHNTAVGYNALQANSIGGNNAAVGSMALDANTTGTQNTAVGQGAMQNNTTGGFNIAVGQNTGSALISGSNNIYLGNIGSAADSGMLRFGTNATHTGCLIQGIYGVTVDATTQMPALIDASGRLGTVVSSRRFKDNIQDMGQESANILKLRPVTFTYKQDGTKTKRYGLIAEEVKQVFPSIVVNDAEGQPFTVQYQELPSLLLNELIRQDAIIKDYSATLEGFKTRLASVDAMNECCLKQDAVIKDYSSTLEDFKARLASVDAMNAYYRSVIDELGSRINSLEAAA